MLVDNSICVQAYRLSPDAQSITWRILHTATPTTPPRLRFLHAAASSVPERAHSHAPLLATLLPPLPTGDWDTAALAGLRAVGAPLDFVPDSRVADGVREVAGPWSADVLDARDFRMQDRRGQSEGVLLVQARGRVLRYRFAVFPEDVPAVERETGVLEHLKGLGLAPAFVGHVREGGKVLGYATEYVGDRPVDAVQDLEKCRAALAGLHEVGVKLGGVSLSKFTKIDDEKVVVTDLSEASLTEDAAELNEETL